MLYRTAGNQVLGNDGFGIFRANVAIPDSLRIDDHHGAVLALVKAAGFVDAHTSGESGVFQQLLQARVQVALSVARTGRPRGFRWPHIVADKNVTFETGQSWTSKQAIPD